MQLNQAVQLVQLKFNAEAQGSFDGPELAAWQEAHAKFPVMMDVATQIWANQIIRMNEAAARQHMAQQAAAAQPGAGEAEAVQA